MAEHTALSVLVLSVCVFLFFKYCLGADADAVNAVAVDKPFTPQGSKCPVGTEYSPLRGECKDLVESPKSLSERIMLLLPYYLKSIAQNQNPH